MTEEKRDVESIAYIKLSKHRQKVFINIGDKLKIPSEISKETGLNIDDVSRALRGLKSKDLVVCLNETDKRARLYELTQKGKAVLEYIY
ncbi:MAG: MarR family transcriptional regulator [Methanobrevibacter sp.]|nr:MarR family transcriptional regulator [Candidatus Methanoflexus mossambicus]